MPFSRGAILGSQIGAGLNKGLQDQYQFQSILNRANQLKGLDPDHQSLALALMGAGRTGGGNPLDAVLAQYISQQLGVQNPIQSSNASPNLNNTNLSSDSFGIWELGGQGYQPSSNEEVKKLQAAGARRVR